MDRHDRIGPVWSVERQRSDVTAPSSVPPRLGVAGVHDQPVEPRPVPLRIAQLMNVPPCEEERLLDRVLGSLDVAEDPICDGVAAVSIEQD